MLTYSPRPLETYYIGWSGPGSTFRDTPVFWNIAWLVLPNVDASPAGWVHHPIEDDIVAYAPNDLYYLADTDYPLVTARYILAMDKGHPFKAHFSESTEGVMMERARSAEARLREGQIKANVVQVDFVLRKRS